MKKLKIGMPVRHDNGQIGEIIDFDDKHPVFNVKVRFQDETQHLWVSSRCLKVHKKALEYKRGDLVKYGNTICVIVDGNLTNNTHHLVAILDGFWVGCEYAPVEHLTKIGSVRKKVKKLKAQLGKGR